MGFRGAGARTLLTVFGVAALGAAGALALLSATSREPEGLGVADGRLAPCRGSPNCVCSQDDDAAHHVEPIAYEGEAPVERMIGVVRRMSGARVTQAAQNYLRAEFTSPIFRFVDDVEFLVDEGGKVIHVRSASRSGYSDLGVNRRRVEAVRRAFAAVRAPRHGARPGRGVHPALGATGARRAQPGRPVVHPRSRGNAAGAFACDEGELAFSLASPGIRRRYGSPQQFIRAVERQYFPVYRARGFEMGPVTDEQGVPVFLVSLEGPYGTPTLAAYSLEKQSDGAWRVNGCRLFTGP